LRSLAIGALILGVLIAPSAASAAVDAPTALYINTVEAMQKLPQPPFIIYDMVTKNDEGLQVDLNVYNHDIWLGFRPGTLSNHWYVAHRASDFRSVIIGNNDNFVTDRAFFDPTWDSAYHAMRDGMFFDAPDSTQPTQHAVPTPAPTPTDDTALTTIASVQVSNAGMYTARDGGNITCPNGDPGHALKFTPRGSPTQYQLSSAVVDTANHLFCVVTFTLPSLMGTPLTDNQYYGERGGYWVRTGGQFVRTTKVTGSTQAPYIQGVPMNDTNSLPSLQYTYNRTLTLRYELADMTFPASLPDSAFITPPNQ
jgi:hypothetical protein